MIHKKRTRKGNKKRKVNKSRSHTRRYKKRKQLHKKRRATKHNKRRNRRRRKTLKGGRKALSYSLLSQPNQFKETVPYKVGQGIPAGKGSLPINGRNYYALAKPNIHAPNGEGLYTPIHMSVPKTFLNGQHGGSGLSALVPQDLVNLGRSIAGGVETLHDNWVGQTPPISSNVMVQPISKNKIKLNTTPPNIPKIMHKSNLLSASI